MTEPNELLSMHASDGQAIASKGQATVAPGSPPTAAEEEVRQRIATLEREARLLESVESAADAAILFHEIGRLWEESLKNSRNAALAYQTAHKLSPRFLPTLRAARRLFSKVGNWQMVVQLLDTEFSAADDDRQKAALLFEKAVLLEEHLSRRDEATRTYRQCLAVKPKDASLLTELEVIFGERGDPASLVAVYRLLADTLEDPAMRAQYLTAAGFLLEEHLRAPADATACFLEAFRLHRSNPLLLAAMTRIAERDGKTDDLLAALAAQASIEGADATSTYLRIAKVYDQVGRKEDALAALAAARNLNPTEPLILSQLAEIYEAQQRYSELADVLLAGLECIRDSNEWISINLQLAALYEEKLKRDDDAAARYRAILARIPGHSSALAGLGRLCYRTQNWEGLLATFEMEAAATEDIHQKVAKLYKTGEVLEERLGKREEAIARYTQCIQLLPGYLPAQQALTHLYERESDYEELAAMFEQQLAQIADPEQTLSILNQLAVLYEDRLSDLGRAIDCMERIHAVKPDHPPTLRSLGRLYQKAARWRELIKTNESLASLVDDKRERVVLYHRNAEILDDLLTDRPGAIAAYERLQSMAPAYLPALKALGRLYAGEGQWAELIRMYRAEAEIAPATDYAAALTHKIGELLEQKLNDRDGAVAAYQEAITLAPNFSPALRALERIYRQHGEWESLIEMLRAEAANRNDPSERANALYQAAAVWEEKLGRQEMAIACLEEVMRLSPSHQAARRALERLYTARGAVTELIAVLDREVQSSTNPSAKAAALLKLARVYSEQAGEPLRASQCCEAVLAFDPANVAALKLLDRIHVSEKARRSELRAQLAARVEDKRLRTALKISTLSHADSRPPDPQVLEDLQQSFAEDPSDLRLAQLLEGALRRVGDPRELARFYEKRIDGVPDVPGKLELLFNIADLCKRQLDDLPRALSCYVRALELKPQLLPALQGVKEVSLSLGDYAAAMKALEVEANSVHDPRSAMEAFIGAGSIALDKLNEPEAAIPFFRKALEAEPLDPVAGAQLEEILAGQHRSLELAEMYEARGQAQLVRGESNTAAASLLQAARTWKSGVGDQKRALANVKRSLEARHNFAEALEFEGDLLLESGQHREAVEAYAARLKQGGSAPALAAANLKLGKVYQDHLSDSSRAAAHLQAALSADGKNAEALERLSRIYVQSQNWTAAADCLQKLLELELPPASLSRYTLDLAHIYDEGFSDSTKASALYRRAMELGETDLKIVDRLIELHRRGGTISELMVMIERHADQATDPKRGAALRVRIGDLYAKSLNQTPKAIVCYRKALERDPQSIQARVGLAELYMKDPSTTDKAVAENRELLRMDLMRVESLHALFKIWKYVKQFDKAFTAAGLLQFLHASSESESSFHAEAKKRLPETWGEQLQSPAGSALIHHAARNPLGDVLRAVGDQLAKFYPPHLEQAGVDAKRDRLKSSHSLYRLVESCAAVLGVSDFQVFQSRQGIVSLENTDPLSVCVSQELESKFDPFEQRFMIGRAALGLFNKTAVVSKLPLSEVQVLLGNAIRICQPRFERLGHPDDELVKKLKKALSRKALRALEEATAPISDGLPLDVENLLRGLAYSADRAGLLFCGDIAVALSLLLRQDSEPPPAHKTDALLRILAVRSDMRELAQFSVLDDHFRLRAQVRISV